MLGSLRSTREGATELKAWDTVKLSDEGGPVVTIRDIVGNLVRWASQDGDGDQHEALFCVLRRS